MRKYDHIFFDLDHTIWDFQTNSREALTEAIQHFKVDVPSMRRFFTVYERINEFYWAQYRKGKIQKEELRTIRFQRALSKFGWPEEELANDFCEFYLEKSPYKTALMPGAEEVLDYLKPNYRLHLITNGFKEVQEIKVETCGLNKWFEELIVSEDVGVKKPHPDIFHHALRITGTESNKSLMIGDNIEADIKGAHGVGMDQIHLNVHADRHNFKPTHEIKGLRELKEIL